MEKLLVESLSVLQGAVLEEGLSVVSRHDDEGVVVEAERSQSLHELTDVVVRAEDLAIIEVAQAFDIAV